METKTPRGEAPLASNGEPKRFARKPPWLRVRVSSSPAVSETRNLMRSLRLNTVCEEAACPNLGECWSQKHATVMILGSVCTRACAFCNVKTGLPDLLDPHEPDHVATAVGELALRHVVITSVDRDDLPDGGAAHFVATIEAIRKRAPNTSIEVLTPDFRRKDGAIERVTAAKPDVYNHNLETVPRLYRRIRPGADYRHSLSLHATVKQRDPSIFTKSGIMVGLGEERDEVAQVMDDLRVAEVDFLTIGQYLRPTPKHAEVARYVHPDEFAAYRELAIDKGFLLVSSSPLTRSSYHADADFERLREARARRRDALKNEKDRDPQETQEWLDALGSVVQNEGLERAHYLIEALIDEARRSGANLPYKATTSYINTIHPSKEAKAPGESGLEHRIRSIIRWNALAMVVQANRENSELGGHIASFASAATLYDVGFNHFFRAPSAEHGGDLLYIQGHCSPGIYARAFLEGRITEEQLRHFRREVDGKGLSSYPHPWLMPTFWQFPTVSMGLGPIMAIYQARFMKYLHNRGLVDTENRKVWAFMGDGEMDEPESLGAIGLAAREKLDNLVFVVNCNLQRLDGPVRGNGKIIQELEGTFRGAGWNVIKVIWGSRWDPLIAKDKDGVLLARMESAVDGDYQAYKARDGAYVREHFFGTHPELRAMVANMTDDEIWQLNRGGHDPQKLYAAYQRAMETPDQPTVILAKTVKGYGMGEAGEGQNFTHQQKKMGEEALKKFRDRYRIPIPDDRIEEAPFFKPDEDSPEIRYMHERRQALGGYLPARRDSAAPLAIPGIEIFQKLLEGSGDRTYSTTMAFVRALSALVRDKTIGPAVVPIVPDEARTFGMEGLFRTLGIYAAEGQLYEPVDSDKVMSYREDQSGQILQEGINEAGALSSWIAAATSYSNHGVAMIPFYIFYSMFGIQRVGDLFWAAGDSRARGFLLGGTSGRTTLSGEGLQHQDGHSQLWASSIPNCITYDPTYAYELAVILHEGLERMFKRQENVFYYLTVMNENYEQPAMPENAREGILRGIYRLRGAQNESAPRVQLMGSGTILREVEAAAELLREDFGVESEIWSVTSMNELRRDGLDVVRRNRLHPTDPPRTPFVAEVLGDRPGPAIAATDYVAAYADQIRPFIGRPYHVLGTDGFGRSDGRKRLRHFFEVNRYFVAAAAVKALSDEGVLPAETARQALERYKIDPDKPNPVRC